MTKLSFLALAFIAQFFTAQEVPSLVVIGDNLVNYDATIVLHQSDRYLALTSDNADKTIFNANLFQNGAQLKNGTQFGSGGNFEFKSPIGEGIIKSGMTLTLVPGDNEIYFKNSSTLAVQKGKPHHKTTFYRDLGVWKIRFDNSWKNITVEVYSYNGQSIHYKKGISSKGDYDLSFLKPGMAYVVKATNGDAVHFAIQKIVN